MTRFEIVGLTKTGGELTKKITLTEDGALLSDGSHCTMCAGEAQRIMFDSLGRFATIIAGMESNKAIALGALHPRLPTNVAVRTKRKIIELNGEAAANIICRTQEYISYRPGEPALVLVDFDAKGMPEHVRRNIDRAGGPVAALKQVLPELADCGHVVRASTSAGIIRIDTGQAVPGSSGRHIYIGAADGSDAERFLRTLHDRCWLHGFGWKMVGAAGQMLDRSIVDRMVYAAERLVFEGAPVLAEPLVQDAEARKPIVHDGPLLNTLEACPPLTVVEQAELTRLQAVEAQRLAADAGATRRRFIDERSKDLAERTGLSAERARSIIEKQCGGVLLPDMILPFDDSDLAGTTVRDVLADPERYVGETLADPIEGVAYGTGKAKIMRRAAGSLWVHSYAHGRIVYDLRLDAASVRGAIGIAAPDDMARVFVRHVIDAELDADEIEQIRDEIAEKTGTGKRRLDQMLKEARRHHEAERREQEHQRRQAERRDPRPQLPVPLPDDPWLPAMQSLNQVLSASKAPEPPTRDVDGVVTRARSRAVPGTHLLTAASVNREEGDDSSLPSPEQLLLTRLDETQLAELIERHIDYVDGSGRSVHLPASFVKHYYSRPDDNALPIVASIATLPIVLPGNTLLAGRGLNRERGIIFRIPPQLLDILPTPDECTPAAAAKALRWLCDEWLVDVACDFTSKCILLASALTVIERSVLPERPAFFVTAGRRGGGKTTTLIMVLIAVTGIRPSAAAWSPNEEERRKALLAYMLEAVAAIIWDNIVRGTQISCAHIEKSCTTAFYSDRRLGVSESVAVAASLIHFFTGNNISPRGDLASRSLAARLEIDRADPENRPFRHPDPVGWTDTHRGEILRNLYVLMLANPANATGSNVYPETRFKMWWRLVGSAVEHAAAQLGVTLRFRDLFLQQEADDEESASLTDALRALEAQWPDGLAFQAADLTKLLNDRSEFVSDEYRERQANLREFLFPNAQPNLVITAKAAGKRLHKHIGNPVRDGDRTLTLKACQDSHSKILAFFVDAKTR